MVNINRKINCKQVDVLPSKNQALCCVKPVNLLPFNVSREQHIATHTNLFLWFNPLNTQVL